MTLEQAGKIVDAALGLGAAKGMKPLCVVVLDPGAHMLALKRDERASIYRPEIAIAKASGCIGMGFGGRELVKRAQAVPAFFAALTEILPKGFVPVAGGVLIRDAAGNLAGAVGVSGDTSDNDELCAVAGIEAAGLVADTGA